MTPTFAEQKALEVEAQKASRKKWLQDISRRQTNVAKMARMAGVDRGGLLRMLKEYGVKIERPLNSEKDLRASYKYRRKQYQRHLNEGRTIKETAVIMGVGKDAVLKMENNLEGKFRRVRGVNAKPTNVVKLTASPKAINRAICTREQNRLDIAKRNFG